MQKLCFCAPCLFGIEGILADELRRMGAQDVTPENGRVFFSGDFAMLARANIGSRYAERILIVLGIFTARSFTELFDATAVLPWEDFIGKDDAFPVKGWSLNSTLHSIPDCQAIIKKAVAKRLGNCYHATWLAESGSMHQIQFSIMKDSVTLMIDTSGAGLHKRGYRQMAGGAPIKETLAAAIADLMRVRKAEQVIDPCCGSGTLLIESALAAKGIAPGIRRRFAFMNWEQIPEDIWKDERERAKSFEKPDSTFKGIGSDIDPEAVRLSLDNSKKAWLGDTVSATTRDIRQFTPKGDTGVVLCNPPYGERLLDVEAAEEIYRIMGQVFVPKQGWSYAIISPHEDFETLFGRKANKRRKLYNGMLKCQLYMYF